MCDYSLEAYRVRPARTGEEYTSHRFPTGSLGFVAPGDCTTAVCIGHDSRLRLGGIPEILQNRYGLRAEEEATFVYRSGLYHDGVRFENGVEIGLQDLCAGITATVLPAAKMPKQLELETLTA